MNHSKIRNFIQKPIITNSIICSIIIISFHLTYKLSSRSIQNQIILIIQTPFFIFCLWQLIKSYISIYTNALPCKILIDNSDNVYFLLDRNGIIKNKETIASLKMFGRKTINKKYHEILPIGQEDKNSLNDWYDIAFDHTKNFKNMAWLAPRKIITSEGKHLKIKYSPIQSKSGNEIKWIACSIHDQTEIQKLKIKRKEEQDYSKMVKLLLKNQEGFKRFIDETPQHIENLKTLLQKQHPSYKKIIKEVHTLKGLAASYFFTPVSNNLKKLEDLIIDADLKILDKNVLNDSINLTEELFIKYLENNEEIFLYARSVAEDSKYISKEKISNHLQLLSKHIESNATIYQDFLQNFALDYISHFFTKYRSIVESMAKSQGKEVEFHVTPSDIMIYPPYYSEIFRNLIHIIRNSIDHGIETKNERKLSNKNDMAKIQIDFSEQSIGNNKFVEIKIIDNGRGISKERLKELARRHGVHQEYESDDKIHKVVFHHGITNKESPSDLSGRGIGLNIIKEKVENLGGEVNFHSTPHKGATVTLQLPLVTSPENKTKLKLAA